MSTTNRDYQGTKNVGISFNPKLDHHYNGAGLHTNISTTITREKNTDGTIFMRTVNELISKLSDGHKDIRSKPHCYGIGIEKRLTGHNETASIEVFSSGVADRGASVRIPQPCVNKAQGYFEDRRPCANANPYLVAEHVVKHLNN
jgi:glutamine synthetase